MARLEDTVLFMEQVALLAHLPRRFCPNTLMEAQPDRRLLPPGLHMQLAIPTFLWRARFSREKRRALLESAIAAKEMHFIKYIGRFMSSRHILVTQYGIEMLSHFYDIYAKLDSKLCKSESPVMAIAPRPGAMV